MIITILYLNEKRRRKKTIILFSTVDGMKKEYERLGCGLDIGKDSFHGCFGAIDKKAHFTIKASRKFDNNVSGIKAFLAWLNKHLAKHNPEGVLPFQLLMETTGVYHEQICLSAYQAGLPVCVEVASRVKKYLQMIGQYTKTDKQDARGICQMACERKMKLWKPCSAKIMDIRSALRHRRSLINNKTRLTNQLHALDHSAYSSKEVQKSIKRLIKVMDKQVDEMEELVKGLYQADRSLYNRLQPIIDSVKGVGFITVLTIVAETNGFAEVYSAKQLASYAGYDIIDNQSGSMNKPSRISKRGNVRIRQVMYMAAVSLINSKSGPIYEFYLRIKKKNPKIYKIGNVAVQRKLLLLVYTLYKNKTSYDPEYHLKPQKNSPEHCPELYEIEQA